MLKIYTPKQWFSIFRCEELIIEDDGLIYNGEDQYKTFRQAIGKIDYASGLIYGEDYWHLAPIPIGKMKQNGPVTEIYGDNYTELMPQPIYYIRDNKIYAADEFYKLFPSEAAYIDGDFNGGSSTGGSGSIYGGGSGSVPVFRKNKKEEKWTFLGWLFDAGFWGLITVIFGLTLAVAACVIPYQLLTGQVGADEAPIYVPALCAGAALAVFCGRKWIDSSFFMFVGSLITLFILDAITTYLNGNFKIGAFLLAMVLGVFLYGIILIVPAIIGGFIIGLIKKPFIKKNAKEGEEKK